MKSLILGLVQLLVLSSLSSQSNRNRPESGVYDSFVSSIGTGLGMQNSLIQGWKIQGVPTLNLMPSPLGQLHLKPDGNYEMPNLNLEGSWQYQSESRSIEFSGELASYRNYCSVRDNHYVIQFEYLDQGVTNYIQYQKKATHPIPDLANPNGNFSGKIRYHSNGINMQVDLDSGKARDLFRSGAPGWESYNGHSVHIYRVNTFDLYETYPEVTIHDAAGGLVASMQGMTNNPESWINKYYWLGEYNDSRELLLLNGYHVKEAGLFEATSENTPGFSLVDLSGVEQYFEENSRSYTASWLDEDHVVLGEESGRIMKFNVDTRERTFITEFEAKDLVVSPDAQRLLLKDESNLHIYELNKQELKTIQYEEADLDLYGWTVPIIRWGPDGKSIAIAVQANEVPEYAFFIATEDGLEARPLLNNKGNLILASSPMFSWNE